MGARSESRRLYPEARFPTPAGGNLLEFLVETFLGEVHGVGDTGHWFECDEVRIALAGLPTAARGGRGRRPYHDGTPVGTEHDVKLLMFSFHDHVRAALCVAHQIAKHIVEVVVLEGRCLRIGEEVLDRFRLSGWDFYGREDPVFSGADLDRPFLPR